MAHLDKSWANLIDSLLYKRMPYSRGVARQFIKKNCKELREYMKQLENDEEVILMSPVKEWYLLKGDDYRGSDFWGVSWTKSSWQVIILTFRWWSKYSRKSFTGADFKQRKMLLNIMIDYQSMFSA